MNRIVIASVLAVAAATPALAADLPPAVRARAPAAYAPPVAAGFSWTGIYIGGNVGAGWNDGSISDTRGLFNASGNNDATFVGGAQVGGNYQFGHVVVGVEGDFDWFANSNNSGRVTVGGTQLQGSNNGRWLTTLTGRLGFAADRVLVYGKGGGAWVGSNNFSVTDTATGNSVSFSNNNTNTGWTAGVGLEWGFMPNVTARIEYDYVGLSNESLTLPAGFANAGDTFSTNNRNIQMVTFGLNYLFNGFQ